MDQVILGQIIHTKSLNELEAFTDGFVAIKDGKIIGAGADYGAWKKENAFNLKEKKLSRSQFLIPGFVDCHIHAPQVPQIGLGLDKPLLEWLETYTFPLEAQYSDVKFAQSVYEHVINSTMTCGTTLACYFATNHKDSSVLLAKEAIKQGQRAFIGKVCSDSNSPDFYIESLEQSVADTVDFVKDVNALKNDLVKPIITPRFAVSCSNYLLKRLGNIAKDNNLHIQSHISENLSEIEFVKKTFGKKYANVYYDNNLLTKKTIMAHAVHLEDDEIALFQKVGASIAHCPASNTLLASGLCDVQKLLTAGIKVGLGTDVSGGNKLSVHDALLRALDVSQHLHFLKKDNDKGSPLNYKQALYLATLGGAEALSVHNKIGNFEIGKDFDALIVDSDVYPANNIPFPKEMTNSKSAKDKLLELLQRFIYVGDDRNIIEVYVNNKKVK